MVLSWKISYLIEKYSLWANYKPEVNSVLIVYSSIYGSTQNTADIIATKLANKGIKNIKTFDISYSDSSKVLSEAFKYSHIILATTTYNMEIFVSMDNFVSNLIKHNLQNRTFAIIENGSWACNCGNLLFEKVSKLKNTNIIEKRITVQSSLKESQISDIENMVELISNNL